MRAESSIEHSVDNIITLSIGDFQTIWTISTIECPEGYALVPADNYFSEKDFCVMIWDAKNVGGVPISQPETLAWSSITFPDACSACIGIGEGYRLITNREWMSIARNIEANPDNWANGIVGSLISEGGGLFRGNVNLNDGVSCGSNSLLDGNSAGSNCVVSGGLFDGRNKRMHILSNGEEIWDFSGNIYTFVDAREDGTSFSNINVCGGSAWYSFFGNDGSSECSFQNGFAKSETSGDLRFEVGPLGNLNKNYGIGRVYSSSNSDRIFWRGGVWFSGEDRGIYSLYTEGGPSHSWSDRGFRCSFNP